MPSTSWSERRFWPLLAVAVAVALAVRIAFILVEDRTLPGGDAFSYHYGAIRLADGLGYTSLVGGISTPFAHHPPGWVTVLGLVSALGGRSIRAHQLTDVAVGLGVVVIAGLVGRRYVNARVGLIAALLAALYAGFFVLESDLLSEPLGLLILGVLTLLVADLRERPTMTRTLLVGATCGLLALARPEQVVLLGIVVVPVLLMARSLSVGQRVLRIAVAAVVCLVVIAPWTIYNSSRFKDPVLLSTNGGSTLLAGNCPPATYRGAYLGYYVSTCISRVGAEHPGDDRSQADSVLRAAAFQNLRNNLGRLPIVIPARIGRAVGVYRPSQTVELTAAWMLTDQWAVWLWVVSFWVLIALAVVGTVRARRTGVFLWPLLAPLTIVVLTVVIAYGEPRYHTPADLGVVVLAAAGIDALLHRRHQPQPAARSDRPSPRTKRKKRLPNVVVPQ